IDIEKDKRVRIIGIIIDKNDNYIMLDDGSGIIRIQYNKDIFNNIKNNMLVRVICNVYRHNNNVLYIAEAIQPLNNLDIQLYRKVKALINR
ncbi:MAG: hypothetical protein J7K26_01730, partial [Candidatus Aenigmarchaeota archaeon]|nr:hypothetical protein [Candidatus Aenigmarchaeota archaeon]